MMEKHDPPPPEAQVFELYYRALMTTAAPGPAPSTSAQDEPAPAPTHEELCLLLAIGSI